MCIEICNLPSLESKTCQKEVPILTSVAMASRFVQQFRRFSIPRSTAVSFSETLSEGAPSGSPSNLDHESSAPYRQWAIQDLMDAKVHLGHRAKLWNPKMAPYVLGNRNGMHVIDLDKTAPLLSRALIAASHMAENDCSFLWLGPQDQQKARIVEKQAKKAGAYTIDGARWIGGTLTNPIKSNQAQRFNYRLPDCVFIIDMNRHMPALKEAKLCGIPTIGIADSDCDPGLLTYPIPGNDDAALAIYLYCSLMKHAIQDGRHRGRTLNRPSVPIPTFESGTRRTWR